MISRELAAEIARRVLGRAVLGLAACQSDPECCKCVDLAWAESETRERFERPVMRSESSPWVSEKGNACGCLDDERFEDGRVLGHIKHCPTLEVAPAYSTDISAAMTVVAAMRARGFLFELQNPPGWLSVVKVEQAWAALFWTEGIYQWEMAATAPEAICRAALAALSTAKNGPEQEGM